MKVVRLSCNCWKDETALSIEPEGMLFANEPPPTESADNACTSGPYSSGTFDVGLILDMSKNGCFGRPRYGNCVCSS